MEKHTIIQLKREGHSNRKVAKLTGINRKTVARYWDEHQKLLGELEAGGDAKEIQERITGKPRYDASRRKPVKYNDALDKFLDDVLESEQEKTIALGESHKQKLTNVQIHQMARAAGHDIGLTVINEHVKEKRGRVKDAHIRQEYEYGQRLEYDFGEVKLVIAGETVKRHIAAFASPGGDYRWAYLYKSQKKDVFQDSHVRFFEQMGGVWQEVVYDNMRNVVRAFIGRNEKQLNEDLVKMSLYYGFKLNVTNCFKGNEKGYVEGAVKVIRNQAFAKRYRFGNDEEAEAHLLSALEELNKGSRIEEEKKALLPYRPPLDVAKVALQRVDKYSFVRVDNNHYSVPEYLVGRMVMVKNYLTEFVVYSAGSKVCTQRKRDGRGGMYADIFHYLDTLERKPEAIRNSNALKARPEMKAVFDRRFSENPRGFIAALRENRDKPMDELAAAVEAAAERPAGEAALTGIALNVESMSLKQIAALSRFFNVEGGGGYVN